MREKLNKIYHSKYFPRLFYKKPDGGKDSGVNAYFLIEWKILFSIAILRFKTGSREAYHNHAFNALTWWIRGNVIEEKFDGKKTLYKPNIKPKYTPRENCHRVIGLNKFSYALTLRGPWNDTWQENKEGKFVTLTHGRKVVS